MTNPAAASNFTVAARRLGVVSAIGTVLLIALYAATLVAGLWALDSPQQPISDPWFSILEILILLLMPLMVALMVAVHAWAPAGARVFSLLALVFMSLVAGVTGSVHFVILTVSRHAQVSVPWLLSFEWPSVSYALDILAWDVFFAFSVLFATPVFGGSRLATAIRRLLVASGALALAGLSGVIVGDMRLRNIAIVGYVGVFPVAAALLAVLFRSGVPREERTTAEAYSRQPDNLEVAFDPTVWEDRRLQGPDRPDRTGMAEGAAPEPPDQQARPEQTR